MMGSWLSSLIRVIPATPISPSGASVSDASAAIFNTKKTPAGQQIDTNAVANAVAAQLQPATPVQPSTTQGQLIVAGIAALGLVLLFKTGKKAGA